MGHKVRIGLIGCGGMANAHIRQLLAIPEAEIVAITDPAEAAVQRTLERWPDLRGRVAVCPTYEDLLARDDVDAVQIHSPHTLHFEQAMAALAAGKHVMIEKPMVCRVEHAHQLIERWKRSGKIVLIAYQRHLQKEFRYARRVIQSGGIGKIEYIAALQGQEWLRGTRGTWRQTLELSGGGQINDSGSHLIDIILWVTGERAEEVFFEFPAGAGSVRDEDVGRILSWRGGALPECYRALGVVEDGSIREDSPLLSRVLAELKRRAQTHEPLRGPDLAEHFDRPPYGWDERVVRLALASLLRHGAIEVRTPQGTFRSPTDPAAVRALTNRPAFKEASFHPAQVLTDEQRREARDLVAEWFGAIRETPEEIDEALRRRLAEAERKAGRLATRLADFRLGGAEVLRALAARAREVLELATPTSRLLTVLEGTTRGEMGTALSLLARVEEWEARGGFEQADEIRTFLAAAAGIDPGSAERLQAMLGSDDLPAAWPGLYQAYQAALAAYEVSYREAHTEVADRVGAFVKGLEEHPEGGDVHEDIARLSALGCSEEEPGVRAAPFRCPACRRSLPDLQRDLLVAGELRSQILRRMQAARVGGRTEGGRLEPFQAKATLTRAEEIAPLTAGLEAYAEEALKDGPIEVEITARPEGEGG